MPSIDLAIAAPIAVALIGGLGVLWRHTTTQIDALRGQLADAIDRIRELEAARLSDRDQHAHQIMALTERSIRNEERTRQVLQTLLRVLPSCLNPGGRAAVLTFHSGEDRRVKKAFQAGLRDGTFSLVARDVVRASPAECRANPRASSAKLRWAVRA
jgi:16S rRNA (cytosine1402-N4)-methyltransferase